ncbi:hypothetical protein ACQPXB_21240 [Amycolatopsis sp. CA-161197]|uniref:hypothetical protein n=1 Tax=Amycolatopsis sp. CA-161197 TaxID=3239922 RepID=UPI003D8C5646
MSVDATQRLSTNRPGEARSTTSMAGKPATPAQVDGDTPVPERYGRVQAALVESLLALPTFAERLSYLLDRQSDIYTRDGTVVIDPAVIERDADQLARHTPSNAFIAEWVQFHSGTTFSRSAMSQLRTGRRPTPRTAIANALADFWRIDPRLLDPTVPAERFAEATAADDTDITPNDLDSVDSRTWELMNEIGFQGVRPREVSTVFSATTEEQKLAFLDVLEGIAKHQRETKPTAD